MKKKSSGLSVRQANRKERAAYFRPKKCELAAARLRPFRKRSATLNGREIVNAFRKDRTRSFR